MRVTTLDAVDVHFGLRLLDRASDHAYWHDHFGVNGAGPGSAATVGLSALKHV